MRFANLDDFDTIEYKAFFLTTRGFNRRRIARTLNITIDEVHTLLAKVDPEEYWRTA